MSHDAAPAAQWEGRAVAELAREWRLPGLLVLESVASTNDVARARAAAGAPAGLLVLAEHQTAGRGRQGRAWSARAGSALLVSFLLRPEPARHGSAGSLPLRIGMAMARAIRAATSARPLLKWPNDLVAADGAKLGGILCEAATGAAGDSYVIAGIGLNVRPQQLAPALRAHATSIDEMCSCTSDRAVLLGAIAREMTPLFTRPLSPLSTAELQEYAGLDALAGRAVIIDAHGSLQQARADGIDADGALRIFGPQGAARVTSATVRLAEHSTTGTTS